MNNHTGKNIKYRNRRGSIGITAAILMCFFLLLVLLLVLAAILKEGGQDSGEETFMELPAEEAIPSEEPAEVTAAEKNAELIAAEQAAREAALKEAEESAEKARIAEEERIRNLPKRIVFLGDSRTVQLEQAVDYDRSFCYFVAEVGMGYDWMRSTGAPEAEGYVTDKTAVVINMGVNDLDNAERYAARVNDLAASWSQRGAKVWYMSVNPVGSKAAVTNEQINAFNSTMKEKLDPGIGWIDTNSMLMEQGFTASDGLHYNTETYRKIYDFVQRELGLIQ